MSELVDREIAEFEAAASNRGTFEGHWEEVAQLVMPSYSGSFQNSGEPTTPGAKRTQSLYDSTAPIALPRFAAVMESMLTPRNSIWHRLVPVDSSLLKDRQTRLWMDEVNRLLFRYRYAPPANFASQNHQSYLSLGAFGTGPLFVDELDRMPGLRYRSIHLGEIFLFENHQGVLDKAKRRFLLSARQAVQWFGVDNLPPNVRARVGANDQDTPQFKFLHCVSPREDRDPQRADYKGMTYASYYLSLDGKAMVREGGYNTFPYAIARHLLAPGEVYGRSPAMEALPAIKTINEQKKTLLRAGHRAVDPVLLLPDDGVIDGFSLKAGALNAGGVTRDGKRLVHELPVGNIAIGEEMMAVEKDHIHDAFLITLFQILTEGPTMTATEVLERVREKGVLLSPTMGRQQSEYLGPLIDREIDVLARQRLLPPMPPALREAGGEYKVEYDSPLSRAQRAEEASGLMRTVEMALNVVNITQNPEPLDHFDFDVIMPEIADIEAVPTKWMRSLKQVQQIRSGRAQQQKQQRAIEALPAAASLAKSAV